jgi:hypothetical protein
MTEASLAHDQRPDNREMRGLELYKERGSEIRHMYGSTYRVPSEDGSQAYEVEYGRYESCSCPDHRYRDEICKHIYCLGIATAKGTIRHPELAAGDPFISAAANRPHACTDGWGFIGHEDEDGGEHIEAMPCKRCREVIR